MDSLDSNDARLVAHVCTGNHGAGPRPELREVRQALEQLKTQVAVEQTEAEVLELTAIKGRKFEETVYEAATSFVSLYADEVEAVGDAGGNKCGDVAVTLNEADTPGRKAHYIVEVKDRKLSLRDAAS